MQMKLPDRESTVRRTARFLERRVTYPSTLDKVESRFELRNSKEAVKGERLADNFKHGSM